MSYPIKIAEYIPSSPLHHKYKDVKIEPVDVELENINRDEDFSDDDGDIIWIKPLPMSTVLSIPVINLDNQEQSSGNKGQVKQARTTVRQKPGDISEEQEEPLDLSLPKSSVNNQSISNGRQNGILRSPRASRKVLRQKKRVRFLLDPDDDDKVSRGYDPQQGFSQPQNKCSDRSILIKEEDLEALTVLEISLDEPDTVMPSKQVRISERIEAQKNFPVTRIKFVDCCPSCCVPFLQAQKRGVRHQCKPGNNRRRFVTPTGHGKKSETATPTKRANMRKTTTERENIIVTRQMTALSKSILVAAHEKRQTLYRSREKKVVQTKPAPLKSPESEGSSHLTVIKMEKGRRRWACRCSAKGKYFKKQGFAEHHVYQASGRKQYKCRACFVAFAYAQTFNRHVRDKHPGIVFSCSSCKIECGSLANIICDHVAPPSTSLIQSV